MSILGLVCLLLAIAALSLLVLYLMQRAELRALDQMADQVQAIANGGKPQAEIEIVTDQAALRTLGVSINQLIRRVSSSRSRERTDPKLFNALGDRIHEAVLIHTDGILYANRQFASFVGVDRVDLVGRRLEDLVAPEYAQLVSENLRRAMANEPAPERFEIEIVGLQGQVSLLEVSLSSIDYQGTRALMITGVEVIPTRELRALAAEAIAPALAPPAAMAVDQLPVVAALPAVPEVVSPDVYALRSIAEAILTTDPSGKIETMNPAAEALLAVTQGHAQGRLLEEVATIIEANDRKLLAEPVKQAASGGSPVSLARRALVLQRAGGGDRSIELAASPLKNDQGEILGAVVMLHDVTELRGMQRQMSYQATHDALTGLVNRREFEHRLEAAIESAKRGDANHVLCYLDMDRFKLVNDTSGHLAGDSMLREIAKLLREAVRDSDTVARLGGDEFGMLLVGCPLEKARQIADDVCRVVSEYRFVWKDRVFNAGISVGLVEIGREAGTTEQALIAADSACYVAKKEGSGRVAVYSARDEALARQTGELQWLQKLQSALKDGRFQLYYQPIVSAYGANTSGPSMEVLVRMTDEAGGTVMPGDFLQAADRYRLTGKIDRWVVQSTLQGLSNASIVPDARSVAINISGQTLGDAQFLEFVVECFDRTGVNPAQVCFEITETAVVANLEHARRFVGVLHGMGCSFTIDDFGSGVGSFSNLKNLPLDYLKIDGSFMRNLARDSVNQAMVTAMIKLARTLNFKIIAEQVEDAAAVDAARRMGVDYLQGYAIARPAPLPLAA
jgi:diguanylate cyclase (GGDEF)-like protein/PAS domain S-box-containing protein